MAKGKKLFMRLLLIESEHNSIEIERNIIILRKLTSGKRANLFHFTMGRQQRIFRFAPEKCSAAAAASTSNWATK